MSDFERGKDPKQKKFFNNMNKERREVGLMGTRQLPVILAKPERDRDTDKDKTSSDARRSARPLSQPTIMLRTRESENRPVSAGATQQRSASVLRKETEVQPLYHLAAKHSGDSNPLASPPEMKSSVKLIDENFQLNDIAVDHLLEQTDFLVVGVLGLQGSGKSTVLSMLAGNRNPVFKPQGVEHHESGTHCTSGVDMMVTPSRIILLDTQPILSASIMDRLIQQESKKFVAAEFASTENAMEIQSLQLAAFLMSVCHVVILVQDWFFDPNLVRFLQSAEMLKPPTPTTSPDEELVEYFPHILFLQNRARPSDFSVQQVEIMQDMYNKTFLRSRLQIQSGMGIATGDVINFLSPETCGEPINLFLLPDLRDPEDQGHFRGHPGVLALVEALRLQLHCVSHNPLTHATLSEKNWFHYASKVLETIKKSSFFMEYSRLLP